MQKDVGSIAISDFFLCITLYFFHKTEKQYVILTRVINHLSLLPNSLPNKVCERQTYINIC